MARCCIERRSVRRRGKYCDHDRFLGAGAKVRLGSSEAIANRFRRTPSQKVVSKKTKYMLRASATQSRTGASRTRLTFESNWILIRSRRALTTREIATPLLGRDQIENALAQAKQYLDWPPHRNFVFKRGGAYILPDEPTDANGQGNDVMPVGAMGAALLIHRLNVAAFPLLPPQSSHFVDAIRSMLLNRAHKAALSDSMGISTQIRPLELESSEGRSNEDLQGTTLGAIRLSAHVGSLFWEGGERQQRVLKWADIVFTALIQSALRDHRDLLLEDAKRKKRTMKLVGRLSKPDLLPQLGHISDAADQALPFFDWPKQREVIYDGNFEPVAYRGKEYFRYPETPAEDFAAQGGAFINYRFLAIAKSFFSNPLLLATPVLLIDLRQLLTSPACLALLADRTQISDEIVPEVPLGSQDSRDWSLAARAFRAHVGALVGESERTRKRVTEWVDKLFAVLLQRVLEEDQEKLVAMEKLVRTRRQHHQQAREANRSRKEAARMQTTE